MHVKMFVCVRVCVCVYRGSAHREVEITQQVRERLSFISNRRTDMLQIPTAAELNRPANTPQEKTHEDTHTHTHRGCVRVDLLPVFHQFHHVL